MECIRVQLHEKVLKVISWFMDLCQGTLEQTGEAERRRSDIGQILQEEDSHQN